VRTGTPLLWPFRSRIRRESAGVWLRGPRGATRPGAGQDREAEPAVCLVAKWEERRSKGAYSGFAIGPLAARPKQALRRLLRQPGEASGPGFEGYILSQVHFVSNLAQFTGPLGPEITHRPASWLYLQCRPQSCPKADFSGGKCRFGRGQSFVGGQSRPLNRIGRVSRL